MFRLGYALGVVLILWLMSLCSLTERVDEAGTGVYRFSWVAWFFLSLMWLLCLVFAEVARRFLKDRTLAILCLLGIPLFSISSLGLLYDRVEVSRQLLRYRRAPPHTRYNADIPWDLIQSGTRIERELPGWTGPSGELTIGYELALRDGGLADLPASELLAMASREIEEELTARAIPINTRRIPLGR